MNNPYYPEAMMPHSADSRCCCTDGLQDYRDIMVTCNSPVEMITDEFDGAE